MNPIIKTFLSIGENYLDNKLLELIEKAHDKNPKVVEALIYAVYGAVPLLKEIAEETKTSIDDELVRFLEELTIEAAKDNDLLIGGNETAENEATPSDPTTPPPPGGPTGHP